MKTRKFRVNDRKTVKEKIVKGKMVKVKGTYAEQLVEG